MEQQIFNILFHQDEITWQSLLLELVKQENIDPWDIDISVLANKYIEMVKEMKKADLRISGKVVLAAAILLRIKSQRFLTEDVAQFDNLIDGSEDELLTEDPGMPFMFDRAKYHQLRLIPRTPQPRKRKVSIYDLLDALKRALDVEERRMLRIPRQLKLEIPEKKMDLNELMTQIYMKLLVLFRLDAEKKVTFTSILPDTSKIAKIYTFIPLLHLSTQRKLDLDQPEHFGEISIKVIKENIDKEIEKAVIDAAPDPDSAEAS
ncbi:MAG: ScpA family protein [Candidatus Woesearchaeota archaeon]|nr:ScpA family protein [Candidatus Woesearchaeota archaeon]